MRTLFIEASNIRAGGGITHLAELLAHAAPERYGFGRVIIWAPRNTLDQMPERAWLEKRTHAWLNRNLLWRAFWVWRYAAREARRAGGLLFSPGSNLVRYRPYVTMVQNQLPFDVAERARFGFSYTRLRLWVLGLTQGQAFKRADGLIFLSEASFDGVARYLSALESTPHIIAPHGLHTRFFKDFPDANGEPQQKNRKLLYVSIVNLYKHQWAVAEAVLQLRRAGHALELELVGPAYPPAMRKLQKVLDAYPDVRDAVHYHGPQPYDVIDGFYQQADFLVFASTCETFGLILLEAMAAGKPLIASDIPVVHEIAGEEGFFFDPEHVESIKAAILRAIQQPEEAAAKARRAQELARAYSWERTAHQTFRLLQEIAQQYDLDR